MYTPPSLVVNQCRSMGGVCQTFGKHKVLVMSALPYSLCPKPVFSPPLVTLTNYALTKGMCTLRDQKNNTTEIQGILYCMLRHQIQIRNLSASDSCHCTAPRGLIGELPLVKARKLRLCVWWSVPIGWLKSLCTTAGCAILFIRTFLFWVTYLFA
jgi:hypothetical protein